MNALDTKPRSWVIWCVVAAPLMLGVAAWLFGEIGVGVALLILIVTYAILEGMYGFPATTTDKQSHMTRNPDRRA